jgi:hypothetical protein
VNFDHCEAPVGIRIKASPVTPTMATFAGGEAAGRRRQRKYWTAILYDRAARD